MGWNDAGWTGDELEGLTPVLSSLRGQGVELGQYYSQHLCTPARAALLTGRYPFRMGMQRRAVVEPQQTWGLPLEYTLLPQYLAGAGYESHLVGKWHLGHARPSQMPTARGFSTSYGILGGAAGYLAHTSTGSNVVDLSEGQRGGQQTCAPANATGIHTTTLYTDRALALVSQWAAAAVPAAAQRTSNSPHHHLQRPPLLLYMAYQNPHFPSEPDLSADYTEVQGLLDAMPWPQRRNTAMLMYNLDQQVGRLVRGLEDAGILDNAIIVFASDNGPCLTWGQSAYPLRGFKASNYEGGTHVRAFVWSRLLPPSAAGTTYGGMLHVTDWLPTLMEAASPGWAQSLEAAELDGVSQWSRLTRATDTDPRTEVVYNLERDDIEIGTATAAPAGGVGATTAPAGAIGATTAPAGVAGAAPLVGSIRVENWKYVLNENCQIWGDISGRRDAPFFTSQCANSVVSNSMCAVSPQPTSPLFNLTCDPWETTDVSKQHPEVVAQLRARLEQLAQGMRPPVWDGRPDAAAAAAWERYGCVLPWRDDETAETAEAAVLVK